MKVKNMILIALFSVIISICSIISIPLPFGVPITLQTLSIFVSGYILGVKMGVLSVILYIILGAIGLPVFAGGSGGLGIILGITGGFIIGFLPMVFLCGLSCNSKSFINKFVFGVLGLICCNILGVLQFSLISKNTLKYSFLTASAPFLFKDIFILLLSIYISKKIKFLIYKI